jgi:hypothetical protein
MTTLKHLQFDGHTEFMVEFDTDKPIGFKFPLSKDYDDKVRSVLSKMGCDSYVIGEIIKDRYRTRYKEEGFERFHGENCRCGRKSCADCHKAFNEDSKRHALTCIRKFTGQIFTWDQEYAAWKKVQPKIRGCQYVRLNVIWQLQRIIATSGVIGSRQIDMLEAVKLSVSTINAVPLKVNGLHWASDFKKEGYGWGYENDPDIREWCESFGVSWDS